MSESRDQSLFALFAERMRAHREATAIQTPDGKRLSYAALDTESGRYAGALLELGLRKGDRVLVQTHKSPETTMCQSKALAKMSPSPSLTPMMPTVSPVLRYPA